MLHSERKRYAFTTAIAVVKIFKVKRYINLGCATESFIQETSSMQMLACRVMC